jgi:ribosomal protein S18 acetylase RimI-like enzyme
VHAAFVEAFSDYVVKFSPTREQLAEMTTRRGYVPEASVGVFEGDRIVAFTLNGIHEHSAYDTGTGVVPSQRRRGLGRAMMDFIEPLLRERGCTRYVLEVLDNTPAAHALYLDRGFVDTRGLQCWTLECGSNAAALQRGSVVAALRNEWWDIRPSWQNATHSILRAHDSYVLLGDDDGYAIVFPSNGDLAQIAVRPEARRRGIGTRLLGEAAAVAGKPLRIMNVDERDEGFTRFLERAGAKKTVRQIEMVKAL